VVICLERDADLHMAQLMPLPLTVSCFSKSRLGPLNEGVLFGGGCVRTQRTPLPTGLYTVYVNWLPDVILYYGPNAGNSRVAISSADVSRCQWRFRTRLRLTDNVALPTDLRSRWSRRRVINR